LFKPADTSLTYPFDILFAEPANALALQEIVDDKSLDPRFRMLASNIMSATGKKPPGKELFAVVVEVGLDDGLDVLASFQNGTARYVNYTEAITIWETVDERSRKITNDLFQCSREIISKIGPWEKQRKPPPPYGYTRISFLVSDGLYFGEGPTNAFFADPIAAPALAAATQLMQYITAQSQQ
jgi:hypothetical protein